MQIIKLKEVSRFIDLNDADNMKILTDELQGHIVNEYRCWNYDVIRDILTVEAELIKYPDELLQYGIMEDVKDV